VSGPKVVHVVRTLGRSGGMERNLYRVVADTAQRGLRHEIVLLSDFEDVIDFGELAPVTRIVTAPNDPRLILALRRYLQDSRPDVVHARNWGAWPDVAVARLLVRPRPALIFSYHGMEKGDAVSLKRKLAFRTLAAATDRIFAVSGPARELLRQDLGVRGAVDVIPNGVDAERFAPRVDPRPPGPLVIGAAGRLHPVKNFPLILDAVARLPEPLRDVRIRIAGEGPERADLEERARALRLGSHLELLGHVEDVPSFLRSLDVFVLSSDLEANPNALLEALATGLPAVGTAAGGTVEVTDQGRVARLVPPRDPDALAQALADLLGDPEARARLGAAARAWILERYTRSRMMEAYEALYRRPRATGGVGAS
jgi:glycosyltransferase involved in cell wall biosynthesis